MTPFRAVLVDLDGTLADTAEANYHAYSTALTEHGGAVGREAFDRIAHGRSWRQFLPELIAAQGLSADPAVIAGRKAELYATMMDRIRINDPLRRLITAMRATCQTALVTTASKSNAGNIIRHHGLAPLFDIQVTGDDVQRHKPDPEAYQMAAGMLGVSPEQCLVFEDSDIGVASATAFGAAVVRISFGE